MSIQIGDALPSATLHEGTPGKTVDPSKDLSTGKVLIFAVPGAFTPGCSKTHLPGYVAMREELAAKGVTTVACVAVNDVFVMDAWGKAHGAEGKVRMLADAGGAFTRALGLDVNAAVLGGLRSKRYAMLVEDGKVTRLEVEPDGFGLTCSLAPSMLETL